MTSIQILQLAFAVDDPLQNLQHPLGALTAGRTLTAGFTLGKAHEETGDLHHTGILTHDHHTAGADDGIELLYGGPLVFDPSRKIHIYGAVRKARSVRQQICALLAPPLWPVARLSWRVSGR